MANSNRNRVDRVEFANTTEAEKERRRRILEDARPRIGAPSGTARPLDEQRASLPEMLASRLPSGASRDLARMALHGLARTGNTILRAIDIPNRVFGNTRSLLQDIYERSEANLARDAYEDRSGVPQVGEAAVHLATSGVLGRALPAVFGANVGADTYETAKYAGASEGKALATGVGHGVVDTAIWTLGQGLASRYLPKAWQWLGRELTGAMRGAASSVTSDTVLNSLGADISGEEMAKRAVHAAWMVPLLGMLKMGGKRREEAMVLLRKARPDLAGEKADKVIETIEAEFADPRSQKVALAWVARKGANLPDDTAQIRQALEVSSKVKGLDPMSRSPFEILSNPAYARYLPKPRPQDVKAFSNMKRYPMGVIGFDVSDDAAGRQATREMINAYMSPSSNPWCLATGRDAAKLGELGPGAEGYWKQHSAVPKQIFFQEVDGKLELTAFRATSPGGEGRQEYWDTSDAGYSGIPIKVKVPGDPMGRYRKMVFRPADSQAPIRVKLPMYSNGEYSDTDLRRMIAVGNNRLELERERPGQLTSEEIARQEQEIREARQGLAEIVETRKKLTSGEVQGIFEDIAPGKVFKGDPFHDGRSQTWVFLDEQRQQKSDGTGVGIGHSVSAIDGPIDIVVGREGGQFPTIEAARAELQRVDSRSLLNDFEAPPDEIAEDREYYGAYRQALVQAIEGAVRNSRPVESSGRTPQYVLVEDKVRTTENGITKFRTTKYADPTDWNYEPPTPGVRPKPVEIEESELVSPEWMRARGYDPESESDVRRMQQELGIQAWGNGVEAAMAVVPTRRTYMQTKSGTPETVTYGPNGRDVVSVDFAKDGVPYREEYLRSDSVRGAVPGEFYDQSMPAPQHSDPTSSGFRLIRNPDSASPEVLNEVQWDEGLGSFVRTSGNRRWRMGIDGDIDLSGISLIQDAARNHRITRAQADEAYRRYTTSGYGRSVFLNPFTGEFSTLPASVAGPRLVVEDRQPDGTWTPAVDRVVDAETGEVVELPPPPPAVQNIETWDVEDDDVPFALKAGRTRRNIRAAEGGGDAGSATGIGRTKRGISWDRYKYGDRLKEHGGRVQIDSGNIKGTGISFDPEKDRLKVPQGREKEYEAYLDKIAELFNPLVVDEQGNPVYKKDGRTYLGKDPSRPASNLVPPDWRNNKIFDRDYDFVSAFLLGAEPGINPEDGAWHMPDAGGKMPTHPGFSVESPYARDPRWAPLAGSWTENGEYIPGEAELKANPDVAEDLRRVRQDALGGETPGSETAVSEIPVSEAPQNPDGPRIVINPQVFHDKRDALCVAFNEAFRVVMEMNGFEPASEPTEAQRKFFSDTAYAGDELQLRRTILARIATLDTSVKDPTDEQLEETAEMLEMVMEVGAPQNEWEQAAVKRLHDVVVKSLESTRANGKDASAGPPDMV